MPRKARIAISTVCHRCLAAIYQVANALEITDVELFPTRRTTLGEIQSFLERSGLGIAGIHLPFRPFTASICDFIREEKRVREKVLGPVLQYIYGSFENSPAVGLAQSLDPDYVVVHHGLIETPWLLQSLEGLPLAVENERPDGFCQNWQTLPEIGKLARDHGLPTVLDTGHHKVTAKDIDSMWPIRVIHVKSPSHLTRDVLDELRRRGYDGWFTIEFPTSMFGLGTLRDDAAEVIDRLRKAALV